MKFTQFMSYINLAAIASGIGNILTAVFAADIEMMVGNTIAGILDTCGD